MISYSESYEADWVWESVRKTTNGDTLKSEMCGICGTGKSERYIWRVENASLSHILDWYGYPYFRNTFGSLFGKKTIEKIELATRGFTK